MKFKELKVFEYVSFPEEIHKIFHEIGCAREYMNGYHLKYDIGYDNYFGFDDEDLEDKYMNILDEFFKSNGCVDGETVLISYSW